MRLLLLIRGLVGSVLSYLSSISPTTKYSFWSAQILRSIRPILQSSILVSLGCDSSHVRLNPLSLLVLRVTEGTYRFLAPLATAMAGALLLNETFALKEAFAGSAWSPSSALLRT